MIIKRPSPRWYNLVDVFSSSTEIEYFNQNISITNDDVPANNTRHQVGAYITFVTVKSGKSSVVLHPFYNSSPTG